jgi:hypothetical protein
MDDKEIDGYGLALDNFDANNKQSPILLPVLNQTNLLVPKYFITQIFSKKLKEGQRKFKLFIPTTSTRNLSTRNSKKSIEIKRVNKDGIELIDGETINPPPKLSEFSKRDQTILKEYFAELSTNPALEEYTLAKPTPRPRRPRKQKTPEPSPAPVELETIYEEPEPVYEEPEPPPVREQKKRGRKLKYATAEEAKLAQQQQKRDASKKLYATLTNERLKQKAIRKGTYKPNNMETQNYENENEIEMDGTGILDNINKGVNQVVNKISKVGKKTGRFIDTVINPDKYLPPSLKRVLNDHGEEVITKLTLRRNPVSSLITGAMNAVSGGTFYDNLKNQPYDKLFHLGLVVSTDNTNFVLEKIERVNVSYSISKPQGLEELSVSVPSGLTVRNLIDNTLNKMGKNKFLDYDGYNNNCQDFMMNVLQSNKVSNEENTKFVKQNTQVLFKDSSLLQKVSKKLTDIGASANVLMKGGEIDNTLENKISTNNITMDLQYLLPHKQNLHNLQLHQDRSENPQALEAGLSQTLPVQSSGSGIGKTIKKIGRQVNRVGNKVSNVIQKVDNSVQAVEDALDMIENIPANARGRYKKVGLDIAEILLKKGVPITAGTIAGVLGTMAGGPALGVASSVGASYLAGLAANKIAKENDINGGGLYAQNQGRGMDSDSEDECCEMCGMSGGKLLIDRKFSVRDVYDTVKKVPKVYKQNMKALEGGAIRGRMGADSSTYTPKQLMDGSGVKPKMKKGSPEMKAHMARLREMRKKK